MSENNIIRNTVLNVTASFLKQESKINEKLEGVLEKKFEKVEFNEAKYAELLKFNILFYKTLARNTEPLIGKWIVDKYIPDIDELEKELELTTAKCRKYVNKAMKEGLDSLKANDLNSFLAYDKMDVAERRRRLEKDYKVLNLYKDLLNISLRKISLDKKDCAGLLLKNQVDAKRELKKEIIFCVNKILASNKEMASQSEEESSNEQNGEEIRATEIEDLQLGKDNSENDILVNGSRNNEEEQYPKMNEVETKFIEKLNSLNYESLSQTIHNEYKKLCGLEELPYVEGYGFGKEIIKDFTCAVIAIEFLKRRNRDLLEGAMRLSIIGEFGDENFKNFINYVIKNKTEISEEIWGKAHSIVEDKYNELENHDIASKRVRKNKPIDIEEYIYMIKNADKDICFKNSISVEEEVEEKSEEEISIKKEVKDIKQEDINEEEIIEPEKKNNKKKERLFGFRRKENKKDDVEEELKSENEESSENEIDKPVEESIDDIKEVAEEESKVKIEKPININELNEKIVLNKETLDVNKDLHKDEKSEIENRKEIEDKKVTEDEKAIVIPISKKKSKKAKHASKDNIKSQKIEMKNNEFEEEDSVEDEEVGSKKSRLKETIIAIVIVAIVGVGYFITVGNNKKNEKDNTIPKSSSQQKDNKESEADKKAKSEQEKKDAEAKAKAEQEKKDADKAKEMEAYANGEGVYYTIYAGSLKVEATAKETAKEYQAKGVDSTIVQDNGYYKVKIGDYSDYQEAQAKCNELAKKSIDTYIAKYDKYYDYKLEEFKKSAPSLSADELKQKYEDLRSDLKSKSGYSEYVKDLDQLYEDVVAGA